MVVNIPRHDVPATDEERGVEVLERGLTKQVDSLEERPRAFGRALSKAITLTQARCAADPRAAMFETWDACVTAMQVGSAMFRAATAEESVACRIAHKDRVIPATGPNTHADAGNWLNAFWLAVVCREQDRMTELCNVPTSLLRASGAVYDDYIYVWVETLQRYWLQLPNLSDKLVEAFDGSDPEVAEVADRDLLLRIMYPPMNVFYRFLRQDSAQFNEALANSLRWHKDYWTRDEERMLSSGGLVALGPLAVSCFAYDANFSIDVESEYIPKHLLQRSWLGEFDT